MKLQTIVLSTFLACGAAACAASPPPRYHETRLSLEVAVRPPEPRVIIVPGPRVGYVWAPGYWRWNGREHLWVDGRWLRERRGSHWVPAHWEQYGDRWRFDEGHWER